MTTLAEPTTAPTEEQALALYRTHLSKGRATLAELFGSHMEVRSQGSRLWTSDGEEFLNCGGYGVFITGARHPRVVDAVMSQLMTHPVATRILLEPTVAAAASALTQVMPPGLDRVHFSLSGAEAVETGLKLARANGYRKIIAMDNGYHGKTMGALSATAKEVYRTPFEPLLPDVVHIPFGDVAALQAQLAGAAGEYAVILEPVQGEAGAIIPPPGYLRAVADLCTNHDAFLIMDEVQTGMGRLGEWWGCDVEGVSPDVLLVGKALGGGVLPVSAAVATAAAFRPFDKDPYLHTATFSGSPILMAAVQGSIQAICEDRLVSRAADLGARLLPELRAVVEDNLGELAVDVRGQGLMLAVELAEPGLAGELLIEMFNHGLVGNHSMIGSSVVRLTPPAVMTDSEADQMLHSFGQATKALIANSTTLPTTGA